LGAFTFLGPKYVLYAILSTCAQSGAPRHSHKVFHLELAPAFHSSRTFSDMHLQENVLLTEHTTLRLGGPARFFVSVTSVPELREALEYAKGHTLDVFVLGGGSNVLFSDQGFDGLVLHIALDGTEYEEDSQGDAKVTAAAGVMWDELVEETVTQGLWGLENLSAIPGTVGAAPVQNIGAYGVEVASLIDWVEVLDRKTLELHILSVTECAFGYRDSIFKHSAGKNYIVTRVAFRLSTYPKPVLAYGELKAWAENTPEEKRTVAAVRHAIRDIRAHKLPDLTHVGSAGSFFKNPIISRTLLAEVQKMYPDIPVYDVDDSHAKVPLAHLLEELGWKGKREGAVGCWEKQPLCMVHYGGGSASEFALFAHKVMKDVKARAMIELEPEVHVVQT